MLANTEWWCTWRKGCGSTNIQDLTHRSFEFFSFQIPRSMETNGTWMVCFLFSQGAWSYVANQMNLTTPQPHASMEKVQPAYK